jgi:hypothetical protein
VRRRIKDVVWLVSCAVLFLLSGHCRALAQDAPVEITGVVPHSHLRCVLLERSCLIISYENRSAKTVRAVRFEVKFIDGMGGESSNATFTDTRKLKPGKSTHVFFGDADYWKRYGDMMKADVAVGKILFSDGTSWENSSTQAASSN